MCGSESSRRGVFRAEVLANEPLCREHYRLDLVVEEFPPSQPGQFVQLQCRPIDAPPEAREVSWTPGRGPTFTQPELLDIEPLLRRPLSLAGRFERDGRTVLRLIYRTIGTGTHWLAGVLRGTPLSVLGPLGNAFPIDATRHRAALVGGGVGIPPMLYLAERLGREGCDAVAFCGARSGDLMPLSPGPEEPSPEGTPQRASAEFDAVDTPVVLASDDASLGYPGLVSTAMLQWLQAHAVEADDLVVYTCGPEPMMRAIADIARDLGAPCWVCMERHMACGMGTCQSCIVKIRNDSEEGFAWKLCCTDGPVFPAESVLWE